MSATKAALVYLVSLLALVAFATVLAAAVDEAATTPHVSVPLPHAQVEDDPGVVDAIAQCRRDPHMEMCDVERNGDHLEVIGYPTGWHAAHNVCLPAWAHGARPEGRG